MPLYEYCCDSCGQQFELFMPVNEVQSTVTCRSCGLSARKVLSAFSFRMGDNWHKPSNIASDGEGFKSVRMSKDEHNKRIDEGSLGDLKDIRRKHG